METDKGLISGSLGADPSVIAFKGIPFAAPAPEPAAAWQGVKKKAEQFSRSCIQKISQEDKPWTYEFLAHNEVSEDCLYLNVWTSAMTAGEKQTVFLAKAYNITDTPSIANRAAAFGSSSFGVIEQLACRGSSGSL